jgi:uncharacterized protein with PIN domain
MSVPCPGCGRCYAESRFASGRTLHCACGARVGGALASVCEAAPAAPGDVELRFAVDAMLGRLARWLRLLGFDAWYEPDVPDERLVRRALDDERWILTRDRALPLEWRVPRVHVVAAETPRAQLHEVVHGFDLGPRARPFARCSRCNAMLVPLAPEEAERRVPLQVRERHARFLGCPACRRIYWEGTHVARIRRVLEHTFDAAAARPPGAAPPSARRGGA